MHQIEQGPEKFAVEMFDANLQTVVVMNASILNG
jgi:hypothetical protein